MKNNIAGAVFAVIMVMIACKKTATLPAPVIRLSVTTDTIDLLVKDSVTIRAIVEDEAVVKHSWKLDGQQYSQADSVKWIADSEGVHTLSYIGGNTGGTFYKNMVLRATATVRPVTANSSAWISAVLDYGPAPGQYINETIGKPTATSNILGDTKGLLNLGAWGGYVVFTFDHSIVDKDGKDLAIYGNATGGAHEWSKPGIVLVSQDKNGNGKADDPWYELAGSEYSSADTKKNYKVTYYNPKDTANVNWKDNLGNSGTIDLNTAHDHEYYPLFAANQDSMVFEGTLLKSTFKAGPPASNPGFSWGYADSYSTGDNYAANLYNSFDISWAVDASGKSVKLTAIDFVKVYTGQLDKGTAASGEIATEVRGAKDLHMP